MYNNNRPPSSNYNSSATQLISSTVTIVSVENGLGEENQCRKNKKITQACVCHCMIRTFKCFRVAASWLMRRIGIVIVVLLAIYFLLHAIQQLFEQENSSLNLEHFSYPLDVDLMQVVDSELTGHKLPREVWPVTMIPKLLNSDSSSYSDNAADEMCKNVRLIVLVKTVHEARANRMAIRKTWGRSECVPTLAMRVLFLFGTVASKADEEENLREEESLYHDILQFDFVDMYQHNTYKMLSGIQYAVQHCSQAKYLVMIDDDYFLNPWRLADYINNIHPALQSRLVAGYVFYGALPKREFNNKWKISLSDYPFTQYPAYPTAGTLLISMAIARNLSVAAKYVRYLGFDDVFLGIVLHKLHLLPVHSRLMRKADTVLPSSELTRYISSHGYRDANQLRSAWLDSGLMLRCGAHVVE